MALSGSTIGAVTGCPVSSGGEALALHLDGVEQVLRHVRDDAAARGSRVRACRGARLLLAAVHHPVAPATGHPVLLAEDGKIVGVCSETNHRRTLAAAATSEPRYRAPGGNCRHRPVSAANRQLPLSVLNIIIEII